MSSESARFENICSLQEKAVILCERLPGVHIYRSSAYLEFTFTVHSILF